MAGTIRTTIVLGTTTHGIMILGTMVHTGAAVITHGTDGITTHGMALAIIVHIGVAELTHTQHLYALATIHA